MAADGTLLRNQPLHLVTDHLTGQSANGNQSLWRVPGGESFA